MNITRVLLCCFVLLVPLKAENYLVTINGIPSEIESKKESVVSLPDGTKVTLLIVPKQYATYTGDLCSFDYGTEYKPEITKDEDGDTTVVFMCSSGANAIVYELKSSCPEGLVDMVLKGITKKDLSNGYGSVAREITQSADGATFAGKEVVTTYKQKAWVHRILEFRGKDACVLVTIFYAKEDTARAEQFTNLFWKTMKLRMRAKPESGDRPERSGVTNTTHAEPL